MAPRKRRRRASSKVADVDARERAGQTPGPTTKARARRWRVPSWVWTLLLVLGAFFVAALLVVLPSLRGPGSGRVVDVSFTGEEGLSEVSRVLEVKGVVSSGRLFLIFAELSRASKPAGGRHLLADNLSYREILRRVTKRSGDRVRVTIPEGFNRFEIGKRLEGASVCPREDFLRATSDERVLAELRIQRPTAEGFLFPATYEFPADGLAEEVVRRMVQEFDRRYGALVDRHASGILELERTLGWGREEIVTLASMVEKEAAVDEERAVIAGVFLNRLRDPKFGPRKVLQSDPTSAYACASMPEKVPSCADFHGRITPELNHDPANVYSTYENALLPPGPIANPGARSLEGVLAPSTHRYFYFVAKGAGRHTFSETYSAHNAAVDERREQLRERPVKP